MDFLLIFNMRKYTKHIRIKNYYTCHSATQMGKKERW